MGSNNWTQWAEKKNQKDKKLRGECHRVSWWQMLGRKGGIYDLHTS